LYLTGEDLTYILEGRIDLREVLRAKIGKAAQEGVVYLPVSNMIS
jgi:ethanolamine utilization protein EutQ (cupin superfamily)